ncbi:MAG: YqgE/AlgH family protein [Bacteroidales bacterium]|nr:YqgE/AlgH family protein [Bacteroidales bacterium]
MRFSYNFFEVEGTYAVPAKGKILISEPFLNDSYFKRSIVLLTEHSEDGAVGFVLNKPVSLKVNEIVRDFPYCSAPVSIGGPVSTNTVYYIHTLGDLIPESLPVTNKIFGEATSMR